MGESLMGFGKINEVCEALKAFKKTGKKLYVYTEGFSGKDYLIAALADVICLPEGGEFSVVGIRAELSFYKDFFEKIGVKADFLQMGDFKGAAETYLRNGMSKENRSQYELVISDLYDNDLIGAIAKSRASKKWTPEQVQKLIDDAPYMAPTALKLGLIDRIAYADELIEQIKKDIGGEGLELVEDYGKTKADAADMSNPFAILKMFSPTEKKKSKNPKIAIVYAVGAIDTGKGGVSPLNGSSIGSDSMVEAIQEADRDPTVKAIVLRVDSPGGSALASDLIWHAIVQCKKPIIASMGDVAASGGYYISMGCNKIYAEPGTVTGSIGVLGGKFVTGAVFDWAGIKTDVVSRGKNAGLMSTSQPWNPDEREKVQGIMREVYDQFLGKVIQGRKASGTEFTKEKLLTLAGGRIWTGRQAKANGLVDTLGTLDDAIGEAKVMAGLARDEKMEYLILPKPTSLLDSLLDGGLGIQSREKIALLGLVEQMPELRPHLQTAEQMFRLRNERVWLMMPHRFQVK